MKHTSQRIVCMLVVIVSLDDTVCKYYERVGEVSLFVREQQHRSCKWMQSETLRFVEVAGRPESYPRVLSTRGCADFFGTATRRIAWYRHVSGMFALIFESYVRSSILLYHNSSITYTHSSSISPTC